MSRSQEWLDEFGNLLPTDDETRALVLDGSIEICPVCWGLSAYAWQDSDAYDQFEDGIIPGDFRPAPGSIAHIGTAGGSEWQCGHCGAHCVDADSPINHPAYTHELD